MWKAFNDPSLHHHIIFMSSTEKTEDSNCLNCHIHTKETLRGEEGDDLLVFFLHHEDSAFSLRKKFSQNLF